MRPVNYIPFIDSDNDLKLDHDGINFGYDPVTQTIRFRDPTDPSQILILGAATDEAVTRSGDGFPKSGPLGSFAGVAAVSSRYRDINTGVDFVNEGTTESPYWSCVDPFHPRVFSNYRAAVGGGVALSSTGTTAGSSLIPWGFAGDALDETDGGAPMSSGTVASIGYGYPVDVTTSATANTAIGMSPMPGGFFITWAQPDIHGNMSFDVVCMQQTAITARSVFIGFGAQWVAASEGIVTGSGTTISFTATSGDDCAGFYFDENLTDNDRWFFPYDKANTNASIATTASQVDTGVDVAAAGTAQRFRVEVDTDGAVRGFINKIQVVTLPAGTLDTTEEHVPVAYICNNANAAAKVMNVYKCDFVGVRPTMPS